MGTERENSTTEKRQAGRKLIVEPGIHLVAIYFSFMSAYVRICSLYKVATSFSYYLPALFLQSFCLGFENTILEVKEKTALDHGLSEIQERITGSMLNAKEHKDRIVASFQEALDDQEGKFAFVDAQLTEYAITGDDFLSFATKDPGVFDRRIRAARLAINADGYVKNIFGLLDKVPRVFSAGTSAFLVNIDYLGRFIGSELALSSVRFFGFSQSEMMAEHDIPSLLAMIFFYKEACDFIQEIPQGTLRMMYGLLFYPVFSGLAIGLYGELEKGNPDIFPEFLRRGGVDHDEGLAAAFDIKKTYAAAKRYYEKYDKLLGSGSKSDKNMYKTLVKNATSAKRFLECRHAAFELCDRYKCLKYLKEGYLGIRPVLLMCKIFFAKLTYVAAKTLTEVVVNRVGKPTYNLVKDVSKSIMKAISEERGGSPRVKDKVVNMEPKND